MGSGPVRSGRPIWWYTVSVAALTCSGALGSVVEAEAPSAASGVTVAMAGGDSSSGGPEPWGLRFRGVETLFWSYAGGVVSISKRFGGEASGSSASRALFLPLFPGSVLVSGCSLGGGCLAYR